MINKWIYEPRISQIYMGPRMFTTGRVYKTRNITEHILIKTAEDESRSLMYCRPRNKFLSLTDGACPSFKAWGFFFCCYTRLFMTWGLHEPLNYSTHLLHCTHAHTLAHTHTHTHILPRSKFTNTAPEPSLCSTASRGRRTSGLTCPHPLQCLCAFEIRGMRDEREKTRWRVRHPLTDMQANIHTKRCSQPMLHNTTRYESALCLAEAKHMHKI